MNNLERFSTSLDKARFNVFAFPLVLTLLTKINKVDLQAVPNDVDIPAILRLLICAGVAIPVALYLWNKMQWLKGVRILDEILGSAESEEDGRDQLIN